MGAPLVLLASLAASLAMATALSDTAHAQTAAAPKELSGVVLTLDAGEIVIDLGKKHGVADGDVLELWRPLKLKHPVSGKLVTDRFRIGSIKIVQVREVMSLAKQQGALGRAVEPGDVVIVPGTAKTGALPAPATTPPTTAPPATTGSVKPPTAPPVVVDADPEVRALGVLFESLHGMAPEDRAQAYDDWVRDHPKSRFAGVLMEEAMALRSKGGTAAATSPRPISGPVALSWKKIESTLENLPITFAFELEGPVAGAVLHLRAADEPAFTPIPLVARGDGYWSVTVPATRVRAPTLSYFVEAVTPDGKAVPVVGSSSDPVATKVVAAPTMEKPLQHENVVAIWTDYANYNRLRSNDYAWQTEGFFGMRFDDVGMRAVRSGFGVYRGVGGSLADLDERKLAGRSVGLSYGYVEGEFGLSSFWGIVARAVVGLGKEEVKGGGQAFIRIGNDKKTNLLLGGEFLSGVGLRGITQIELAIFKRVPILVRSEVTNQPAGEQSFTRQGTTPTISGEAGDVGVRAIVQAGYRITPAFTVFLRGSYQGRTINHAGPGVGAGASFVW